MTSFELPPDENSTSPLTNCSSYFCVQVTSIEKLKKPHTQYRVFVEPQMPNDPIENVSVDAWHPTLAPSGDLWNWFQCDEEKWYEFRMHYNSELEQQSLCHELHALALRKTLQIVYRQGCAKCNIASAIKEYLELLECRRRYRAGLMIGGYTYPHSDQIQQLGGLWYPRHKAWVMPDRKTWEHIQSLVNREF